MSAKLPSLDVIDVASPCNFSWEKMQGSDTIRHCPECKKNVYNLSGLSREQALQTIEEHDGKLCVRFYRRHDGTILTQDCPVGIRAVRRRLARMVASMAAMVAFLTWGTLFARGSQSSGGGTRFADGPLTRLALWSKPDFPIPTGMMVMGDVCVPPPPALPPGGSGFSGQTEGPESDLPDFSAQQ